MSASAEVGHNNKCEWYKIWVQVTIEHAVRLTREGGGRGGGVWPRVGLAHQFYIASVHASYTIYSGMVKGVMWQTFFVPVEVRRAAFLCRKAYSYGLHMVHWTGFQDSLTHLLFNQ